MATPYSDTYKKRMQNYFSKREPKIENIKSEVIYDKKIKSEAVKTPEKTKEKDREIRKEKKSSFNRNILAGLILLFLVLSFFLLYIVPENPVLWGIVLGFCVIAVFLFLFLFHKTYEKIIENIGIGKIMIFVYFLLIVNMFLSGFKIYSVEWAFLGFVIGAVIFYDAKIDSRFLILPALILLGYVPFLLIAKQNVFAETIAIYVYYFLVVGVGLQVMENFKGYENSIDFEKQFQRIMHSSHLGEWMIGVGLISIVIIIMNRFMELDFWKWTSVYAFAVLLVVYVIGLMDKK